MSNTIQIKTGTTAPTSTILSKGELGYDTTNKKLYIGTGSGVDIIGESGIIRTGTAIPILTKGELFFHTDTKKLYIGQTNTSGQVVTNDVIRSVPDIIPIEQGGTGATTTNGAINNIFGVTNNIIPISKGGTGATTAVSALQNLLSEGVSNKGLRTTEGVFFYKTTNGADYQYIYSSNTGNSLNYKRVLNGAETYATILHSLNGIVNDGSGNVVNLRWVNINNGYTHRGLHLKVDSTNLGYIYASGSEHSDELSINTTTGLTTNYNYFNCKKDGYPYKLFVIIGKPNANSSTRFVTLTVPYVHLKSRKNTEVQLQLADDATYTGINLTLTDYNGNEVIKYSRTNNTASTVYIYGVM